ncbi:hypothetical protein HYY71_00155, partial [Candidatus Woesearchaeota archaeon]|nr:hypothetical protein [Candidatus Woesearchaeota archaeon]
MSRMADGEQPQDIGIIRGGIRKGKIYVENRFAETRIGQFFGFRRKPQVDSEGRVLAPDIKEELK